MNSTIKSGEEIRIKTEWQDPGDRDFKWIAIEDEDGGRIRISAVMDLPFPPNQVVTTDMIERV